MSEPRVIDLDAARVARAEVAGDKEAPSIRFGGRTWRLPNEMPFTFADLANQGKIGEAVRALLDDQADDFFALAPTLGDVEALAEGVASVYGMDPGKLGASPGS